MPTTFLDLVKAGDLDRVNARLQEESDLARARHDSGLSALMLALYHGRAQIADALLRHRTDLDVFEAAALGRTDRVEALLTADPSAANQRSPDGFTPLGLAAFFGREDVLKVLTAQGADVNAASENQMRVCPLHSAVAHRQPETALAMAKHLLAHGASANVAQHGGWTPLHQAAAHGHAAMVELLLAHGAHPHTPSEDGQTAHEMAVKNDYADVAAMLTTAADTP